MSLHLIYQVVIQKEPTLILVSGMLCIYRTKKIEPRLFLLHSYILHREILVIIPNTSINNVFRYFLNIFVDTTIGVGILWGIHAAFQYILIQKLNLSGLQTGVYGDPPLQKQTKRWVKQLAVYIASLILMKLCVILLFHIFPQMSDFGHWVLQWTMGDYKLQVVFVMLM